MRHNLIHAFIQTLFLSLVLAASWSPSFAHAFLDTPQQNQAANSDSLLGGGDDFLPVTEAFQLETHLYEDELTLHWEVAPDYYLYKSRFQVQSQDADRSFEPRFSENSVEKYDEYFEKDMAVYYDTAQIKLAVSPDQEPFTLQVQSQGCADAGLCYPPHTDYLAVNPAEQSVTLVDEAPASTQPGNNSSSTDEAANLWLPQVLLFALLGGVILNLMPCVFPVLSIKVMSLAQADRERLPLHGWAYTLGIVLCFLIFAGILLLARAGGEAIGWGFQLQSPLLVAALAYLFFILGLMLSGTLNLGTAWMGMGQNLTEKGGLTGSFFTGVLAAVVASPCTAPFMGVALGFALTQPVAISLSVFIALALGMALPLLVLCYLPALARYLPQPGPWMDTLKQFLAFPLYLTTIWLLWVLGRQAGIEAVIALCLGALAILFAVWLRQRSASGRWLLQLRRLLVVAAWATAFLLPWQWISQPADESRWEAYSAERLQSLRDQGRPVFVNLTADWCLTCLANERMTLSTQAVADAFDQHQVATLKGDWTNGAPHITELLDDYGRSGVPLYLWFPSGHTGPGEVLPQLLRKDELLKIIKSEEDGKKADI